MCLQKEIKRNNEQKLKLEVDMHGKDILAKKRICNVQGAVYYF